MVWLALIISACGGSIAATSRAGEDADQVEDPAQAEDAEQLAWNDPLPGRYLLHDATLVVGEGQNAASLTLLGEWPASFLDRGRVRVSFGETELEGRRRSNESATPVSCTREPLRFSAGDMVIEVAAGGRVSLLGSSHQWVRVVPPFAELAADSQLVDASTISLEACAERAPVPDSANGSRCLFAEPTSEGARLRLPAGAALERGEQRGDWVAVRSTFLGARIEGWMPMRALEPPPTEGERWVRTAEDVRLGPLTAPAGTAGRVLTCRRESECTEQVELILARDGRVAQSTVALEGLEVEPASRPDEAPLWFGQYACDYPDTPRGSAERSGRLSRASIRRVITAHINEVRACYERRLDKRPRLEGRLLTSFIIGPTGRVETISTLGDVHDRYLQNCIARAVADWQFPVPENQGFVGVNYPFVLSASP